MKLEKITTDGKEEKRKGNYIEHSTDELTECHLYSVSLFECTRNPLSNQKETDATIRLRKELVTNVDLESCKLIEILFGYK